MTYANLFYVQWADFENNTIIIYVISLDLGFHVG
jgi:hypothetical protein